jgi:hypothetical protein
MGMYEDFFYEIYEKVEVNGLRKEYDEQIEKMRYQDHHKYSDTKTRMQYACDKVIELKNKK